MASTADSPRTPNKFFKWLGRSVALLLIIFAGLLILAHPDQDGLNPKKHVPTDDQGIRIN